jgi:hypothetical protein
VCRIQIVAEGKKRKLIIKNCKLEDGGMITAKTNSDEVSAPLEVNCKYLFCNRNICKKVFRLLSSENWCAHETAQSTIVDLS